MRVCIWHGWLLEGTGSNVYTAKLAEAMRAAGHDVLLVCQERHPERLGSVDSAGAVDAEGVTGPTPVSPSPRPTPSGGRATVLRPEIGGLLPVFVLDEYEGWDEVKRFVDLTDAELSRYLDANAVALRTATEWHRSEVVIAGHAIPGPQVALRALGPGRFAAKVHGSDLEYAIRLDPRYADLAREGLEAATTVIGMSDDVLARTLEVVPGVADRVRRIAPGVETDRFTPRPRMDALLEVATLLAGDPDVQRGRPTSLDARVARALAFRDAAALNSLAHTYDQRVPDPDAAGRLRRLSGFHGSLVGSFGKLIVEKGVERVFEAFAAQPAGTRGLVIGFGGAREWLTALAIALDAGDPEATAWLRDAGGMKLELGPEEVAAARGVGDRLDFTGLLDHRYAPLALAALEVLVVPSTLKEAFGLVAAEGAAAGALLLVARHSGLAEIATALEGEVGRPGWFSFEPGPGATRRLTDGLTRLFALPPEERAELRRGVSDFVAREWTWERAAERVLTACARADRG